MKTIDAAASEAIRREIFQQILALDDKRQAFKPPWGTRANNRMRRLIGERMRSYSAAYQQEMDNERTENPAILG